MSTITLSKKHQVTLSVDMVRSLGLKVGDKLVAEAFVTVETFLQRLSGLTVRPVDRNIARQAADVYAGTRLAPLGSIIVATGLEERCNAIIGNDAMIASRIV